MTQPTCTDRPAEPGETCSCGRPAVIVYVVTDENGTRDVPHCGVNQI
jgi:hypothetical protein